MLSVIIGILFLLFVDESSSAGTPVTVAETTLDPKVPLEFPKYDEKYNFINNSTIRDNLASHNRNHNNSNDKDTEVVDLLLSKTISDLNFTENPIIEIESKSLPESVRNDENPSILSEDLFDKNETEWIENGENTEDILRHKQFNLSDDGNVLVRGQMAAVLAGVFLIIAIIVYGLLLSWRQHLETKYGSREMLVDEEMNDPDDMRHFTI